MIAQSCAEKLLAKHPNQAVVETAGVGL